MKDSFEYQTWQKEMKNQLIFINFWHYVEIENVEQFETIDSILVAVVSISIVLINRFNHSRKASQDQDKQSQDCDNHEKSIEMQQQKSSERRDQREKCVKNSEELVQLVRIKNVKRFVDQVLNHYFRQQSKRHELRSTIQNDNAEHSKNDYQRVDQ